MPDPTGHRPEEDFASALDALVSGHPHHRDPLARFGASVQRVGAAPSRDVDLDRAARGHLWAQTMRAHAGTMPSRAVSPGIWNGQTPSKSTPGARRTRSSPHTLGFMPDMRSASTMTLVIAVMALVGALFAGLDPDGARNLVPSASATEHPETIAYLGTDATPEAEVDWLQPVTPDECTVAPRPDDQVAAIFRDTGDTPERQHLPVSPADPDDAAAAARAWRTWAACDEPETVAQRQAMESPAFIVDPETANITWAEHFDTFEEWHAFTVALREAYIVEEPGSYIVLSDEVPAFDPANPEEAEVVHIAQPGHVLALPDGRLLVPLTWLVREGLFDPANLDEEPFPGTIPLYLVTVARDDTQDGRWVIDEYFTLCLLGCDLHDEEMSALWYPADRPSRPPAATPHAEID